MEGSLYAGESWGASAPEPHGAICTIITRSDFLIQQRLVVEAKMGGLHSVFWRISGSSCGNQPIQDMDQSASIYSG